VRLPRPGRDALRAWLASRAALLALMALAEWLQARHGVGTAPLRPGDTGFFVWDSYWYREIAAHGYATAEAIRFFPLVALPARVLAPLGALAAGIGVLVVSNLSALAYAEGVARLTRAELRDESAARLAPWLVLVNPAAFVLVLGYAEATAGLLAVWCFWALRRGRWGSAAAAAFLGGLTRPVGVLLALPALVEALRGLRGAPRGEVARRALAVAAAPLGCAAYLGWVGLTRGNPLLPFQVQQEDNLRNGVLVLPFEALGRAWHALLGNGRPADALHFFWVPVVLVLLVVVWRRLPLSYALWSTAIVVLAVGTPRLASLERYSLSAFPLIMVAALPRSRGARIVTLMVCCVAYAGYSVLAFTHRYVP
jgi:hypothetical protein